MFNHEGKWLPKWKGRGFLSSIIKGKLINPELVKNLKAVSDYCRKGASLILKEDVVKNLWTDTLLLLIGKGTSLFAHK